VTRRNGMQNGYLRPLAYFGTGPIDLRPKKECPVRVFIAVRELGTFLGEDALRNGIRVTISSLAQVPSHHAATMAKASGHYAKQRARAHEAMDRGYDDAILLNQEARWPAPPTKRVLREGRRPSHQRRQLVDRAGHHARLHLGHRPKNGRYRSGFARSRAKICCAPTRDLHDWHGG